MNIDRSRVVEILDEFKKARVLVIGDLILDQFIWGDVSRISPEAPVPVVLVEKESFMPGGAANVACNISVLSGQSNIVGVVGKDLYGRILRDHLKRKTDISGVIIDKSRQTTLKTRIVARHQQVVRVDKELVKEIDRKISNEIIAYFKKNILKFKAVIIEDYGKGVINPYLLKELIQISRKNKLIITVDPKEENFCYYKGVTCITPNQHEAEKAAGIPIVNKESLLAVGRKLLKILNSDAVLITRGEHGMCLFRKGENTIHIPTKAQEVFDVSGAGDTVIAAFTLALASGASFDEAARISNYAAGVVVGKIGVACCNQRELLKRIDQDMPL